MVILQFNKLIRNKWFWGAFAILISAAFCFDDLFTTREREERNTGSAGTLAGESVKADLFATVQDEVRGLGRNRDWRMKTSEVNAAAWRNYAALFVADRDGLEATDDEVVRMIRSDRTFAPQGQFSYALYQGILRENGLTPEAYEAYLKRRLTLMRIGEAVLGAAAWTSPAELDRAVADVADTFTVRVASFVQDKAEADKVTVDDAAIKAWYDENAKSLELPERIKIRMVKFDATDPEFQAKMTVTEEEMRDLYDATIDKYTSTDTNGVETVKSFEDVKAEIEKDLRLIAAVQCYETNLQKRVYAGTPEKSVSRLDKIAAEDGLKVESSDWFALDGAPVDGFMKSPYAIAPGARDLVEKVAELDMESEDLRYGVVVGEKSVWLVEKAEISPAHVPTLEEAKDIIRPRVLKAAKDEAFKASVEAIAKKGAEAVLATKDVSTNITFAVFDMKRGAFADQNAVAGAVRKLVKGEVSAFTRTGEGRAILVVCTDRVAADPAKALVIRSQIRDDLSMLQRRQLPDAWQKWNLERLGYETSEISSVEDAEDVE